MPDPQSPAATRSPSFTLPQAEQVVRKLMPALQEHGKWVKRIHTILICRTDPAPEDLEEDAYLNTDLGRWFADADNDYVRRHPGYETAFEGLRRQYGLAGKLCRAVRDEQPISPEDYEAFADSIHRFDDSMEALVRELWDLLLNTDPLTGIATRLGLLPRLKEAHERTRKEGHACAVCMIDLDHFKRINDTHGHRAGDQVLASVSGFLQRNLRHNDHICRYGGEEFVLMLPGTDIEHALPLVDRLRHQLSRLPILLDDGTILHVTASFGIAPLSSRYSVRKCIEYADRAMYEAKEAGRNQVCIFEEPT